MSKKLRFRNRWQCAGLLALCAASLALPGVASASHNPGNGPGFDKTNGTGENAFGQIHVNAKSVEGTTVGSGRFFVRKAAAGFGGADVSGDVTCHRATLPFSFKPSSVTGGVVERSSNPALVGRGILIYVQDDDPDPAGLFAADPDDAGFTALPAPPTDAQCTPIGAFEADIIRGNYVVHDGA